LRPRTTTTLNSLSRNIELGPKREEGFGLGAALYGAITLKDGKVEQTNFDGCQVLRIDEMPKVEVHIVPSPEAPTGVGEPGVAPIGPAVANAVFALGAACRLNTARKFTVESQ
jgi:hypothetical protein